MYKKVMLIDDSEVDRYIGARNITKYLFAEEVITHVNGTRVMSMTGAAEVLRDAQAATLELRREGSPRVVITLN